MPPRDPRLCPALERALPPDAVGGSAVVLSPPEPWLVLFGDGEWHLVDVRQRSRDKHGHEVIGIEWRADGSTWSGSYIAEAGKTRKPDTGK